MVLLHKYNKWSDQVHKYIYFVCVSVCVALCDCLCPFVNVHACVSNTLCVVMYSMNKTDSAMKIKLNLPH